MFGGVFEVDGPGLLGVEVEFTGDAYMVFGGVEEMLEQVLLGGEMDLATGTVMVGRVLVVVGVEVLLLPEDDIAGGADEASGGVDSIDVGLAVHHFWRCQPPSMLGRSGEGRVNLERDMLLGKTTENSSLVERTGGQVPGDRVTNGGCDSYKYGGHLLLLLLLPLPLSLALLLLSQGCSAR